MPLNRRHPSHHLVCQHLERISRRVLERYQDIIRDYVRGRHGIYVLFREGELYYIGLATDLRTRLTQHLRDRHGISWDQFSIYLTIQDSHLKELESLLLRIIRPPGNRQSGKLPRSEDLHARFKSDIQVFQHLELNNLLGKTIKSRTKTKDATSPTADENVPVLAKYREPSRVNPGPTQESDSQSHGAQERCDPFSGQDLQLPFHGRCRRDPTPHMQWLDLLALRARPR